MRREFFSKSFRDKNLTKMKHVLEKVKDEEEKQMLLFSSDEKNYI